MDKRSWPWKKKSSDKQLAEKANATASEYSAAAPDIGATQVDKVKQDNKKAKYVQISFESYARLTGLEDQVNFYEEQVKTLEDEVKELNEKLSEAQSEMTDKENLVKQHAKVAEEAVSGWEKAEAEAAALKNHLESVTLLKLTAEDQASRLDGALKECMRQIKNLKEEHDKKLHEVVLNKTKLFDKMKLELESRISNVDQELMMSAAENAALSRSLQERSSMLIKLNEEKSKAEAEIECLRSNIESCEKEINSLKYEVHIARKEAEIRNEEKNMSVRSAEVANKQHLEGVKKIAKLEAECQRLRGLVRKKLPGPAALAQMKLEVENLGRDYGESRSRRSPMKPPTSPSSHLTEFSLNNTQNYQKENELLTERLLALEEETNMLREALAKRNSELQTSRSIYAQTASKVQNLESQLKINGDQKSPFRSGASMSEDGNNDNASCSGSWATVITSDVSYFKKEKNDSPHKSDNTNHIDLMDDFLEMEKLAHLSNGSNEAVSRPDVSGNSGTAGTELVKPVCLEPQVSSKEDVAVANQQLQADPLILMLLQTKISTVLESISNEKDMEKLIEEIRPVLKDMHETLHQQSVGTMNQDLEIAISVIYEFVRGLGKEGTAVPETSPDGDGLNEKLSVFSSKYGEAMSNKINLVDFVLDISHVLSKANEMHFSVLGFKSSLADNGTSHCIDKIALPENKAVVDPSKVVYPNGCAHFSYSGSDPDVPNLVPASELTATPWKCSLEEFDQLKMDKDNLAVDLVRCKEEFDSTKSQLLETEQLLADVKSQLTSAQKANSLAETQLKCMAESYNSLEKRADDLQIEVNLLQGKIESLDNELQEERRSHQNVLNKCKDLQEQLQRIDCCSTSDNDDKTSQEKDLAAAAEKLAECQETIFLLGKQLKSLHPETNIFRSSNNGRIQKAESSTDEEPTISGMNLRDIDPSDEMDTAFSFNLPRAGSESTLDPFNTEFSPSDSEANNLMRSPVGPKYPNHRHTKSGSSSAPTPEKHARGFSRFFSSKVKN